MKVRPVRYWVGRAVLTALGWREEGVVPDIARYVLVAAPHTSNWDLPITLGIGYVLGMEVKWIGKHTLFEGPSGGFFRWLGGIPVDRRAKHDQVQQIAEMFRGSDKLTLVIAPEGTRVKLKYWKSGFYWVARAADVPIVLGYLDYRRRRGGIGPTIVPTGDVEADVARIREFYATVTPKHPAQFNNIEFRPEGEAVERPAPKPPKWKRALRAAQKAALRSVGAT